MEKRQRELESLVSTQKEQLTRYEKRLKDVVTAYKGLMKEKEALETSLTAHAEATAATGTGSPAKATDPANVNGTASADATDGVDSNPSAEGQLQTQIITLMNSLATLSAEKSRMEASFQADKKQLRSQIAQKELSIQELHAKSKEQAAKAKADVDEVKAKWIIERQEREKETNNQMLMIRELQKLYADERHLKDNIEMQLNNFKTQFASNEAENSRLRDLQAQLKEARHQLKQFQAKAEHTAVATSTDNASLLHQVRQEMQQLKEQHAVAIKQEQRRVLRAEEQSRKQAALHEGRVANLEARLAELSTTVGSYDRLRQQDQDNIHALKQQLQDLEQAQARPAPALRALSEDVDLATLVDEIVRLKKLLTSANARSANPIDLNEILSLGTSASAPSSDSHVHCEQQLQGVQKMLEAGKQQRQLLEQKIQLQQSHIQTLQEKVQVLNRNIDESEQELKQQGDKLRQALKMERTKWQEAKAELENETRCKLNELEQLLQKQRQRSLQLLDEKEQEIKTLQTSFEVFHTAGGGGGGASALPVEASAAESYNYSSDGESVEVEAERDRRLQVKSKKLSLGENCHMLHYANELARKDIEITTLRKAKYSAESTLRKAIQDKVTSQQEMHEKIECLEEQVDRLERCKTREGANLEYLKNVIISYILTRDADGKRHMLNAISAVLQFTSSEMQAINATFQKK
ncbi:GRIP and coiled-coil domain-containing protein 1 [Drosophila subobscura]|uniref:GRIP and coiled-coil domain-containing protein 1 n=1 Tax=Drosophila subobscura TaxID=7241 RepID=UPI00155B3CB3|nr:GRIP and coiled-coil domain-containing protein 1 [Drosophila subobscura]